MAPTGGNALKVCQSLQCGAGHHLCHTTWCWSGGQFFCWVRCHWLEAVKNHRRDPSQKSHCKALGLNQYRILPGTVLELDTANWENDLEMKKEAEERKLHRMCKVHDFLEMWQGSQNLAATWKESCAQNKQMTAVRSISDTQEIFQATWSLFQHDGAVAFKLSERSSFPPP